MAKGTIARASIIGRMGKAIEIKDLTKGKVGNFSLAVNQGWGDKQTTSWFNIVIYNDKKCEVLRDYTEKGSRIMVEGELRKRKYTSNGEEKEITEIVVAFDGVIEIIDGIKNDAPSSSRTDQKEKRVEWDPNADDIDDSIPF